MGVELPRGIVHRTGPVGRVLAIMALILLGTYFHPESASAQDWSAPRTVFVPTTGHTSDGLFLDVWRTARDVVGDPVTEEFRPRTGFTGGQADVVQYYE